MQTFHADDRQKRFIDALEEVESVIDLPALLCVSNGYIVALVQHSLVEAYKEERSKSHRREKKEKSRVSI